jgi:hypothetical protein
MPHSIQADCPHCSSHRIGFTFVAEYGLAPTKHAHYTVLYKCNKCKGALVHEYSQHTNYGSPSPGGCSSDPTDNGFKLLKSYPGKMPNAIPAYVPAPLDRYYQQALDSLHSAHYDASGAMSRKVVDVSTQQMVKGDTKKYNNIRDRIDALAEKHLLTPDLKDWAHQIRLDGNDASHDEDPFTADEAQGLLSFTELYLTYVYTLPGRLKARREQATAPTQPPAKK